MDRLFEKIPKDDTSYTYYKAWSSAVGRTLASIRATFSSRMSVFNLSSMKALTYKDEMNLLDLATKKVAIFMVIPDEIRALPKQECVLYTPYYGVVRDLKYDMTRHPFYDQVSDGNGVAPYVWGEADLAVGGVRVLDPSYAGELTVLPKANGVLLDVED